MNTSSLEKEKSSEGFEIGDVAAWLKATREERGETIDDVARVTRIGKNYLEAIEAGDLCKLPSQAYTRGFIRLYASHLGLSSEQATVMMNAGPTAPEHPTTDLSSDQKPPYRYWPAYRRNLILTAALTIALTAAYLLLNKPTMDVQLHHPRLHCHKAFRKSLYPKLYLHRKSGSLRALFCA